MFRYILADLISFLEIQRLQLAGSSSTVFAVNLILYYQGGVGLGKGGQEGSELSKSTHQTPFISINRKRIGVESTSFPGFCPTRPRFVGRVGENPGNEVGVALECFFGMIWIRISDPLSRITVHQMKQ